MSMHGRNLRRILALVSTLLLGPCTQVHSDGGGRKHCRSNPQEYLYFLAADRIRKSGIPRLQRNRPDADNRRLGKF